KVIEIGGPMQRGHAIGLRHVHVSVLLNEHANGGAIRFLGGVGKLCITCRADHWLEEASSDCEYDGPQHSRSSRGNEAQFFRPSHGNIRASLPRLLGSWSFMILRVSNR